MTLSPRMAQDVERLIELVRQEADLRERARGLEHGYCGDHEGREQARPLYEKASEVRRERLELLRRCGLS